jgi:hypothetical protein
MLAPQADWTLDVESTAGVLIVAGDESGHVY